MTLARTSIYSLDERKRRYGEPKTNWYDIGVKFIRSAAAQACQGCRGDVTHSASVGYSLTAMSSSMANTASMTAKSTV